MKQNIKNIGKLFLKVSLPLFFIIIILNITSCGLEKREFDSKEWKENSGSRNAMVDSLIKLLKLTKPNKNQVIEMLGKKQDIDDVKDDYIEYYLKSNAIIGIDYSSLVVSFEDEKFLDANIVRSD